MPSRIPGGIEDDIGGRVAWNGTEGLAQRARRLREVVLRRSAILPPRAYQPNSGRTNWSVAIITSQAIGTAAKKPSAALHGLRRRTVPDPVDCGTSR